MRNIHSGILRVSLFWALVQSCHFPFLLSEGPNMAHLVPKHWQLGVLTHQPNYLCHIQVAWDYRHSLVCFFINKFSIGNSFQVWGERCTLCTQRICFSLSCVDTYFHTFIKYKNQQKVKHFYFWVKVIKTVGKIIPNG